MLFPNLNVESDFDKAFGKTMMQTTARPLNVRSRIWHTMSKKQKRDAQEYWADVLGARDRRRLSKLRCWARADYRAQVHRTTTSDGPRWDRVHRRAVTDARTGQFLLDQDVRGMTNKGLLYAKVPGGPRDIATKLCHDDPNLPATSSVPSAKPQELDVPGGASSAAAAEAAASAAGGAAGARAPAAVASSTGVYACFNRLVDSALEPPRQAHRPCAFAMAATPVVIRAQEYEAAVPMPAMPLLPHTVEAQPHRERLPATVVPYDVGCCMVARQLPKNEVRITPAAIEALDKEWDKLIKQNCWHWSSVREDDDVTREAHE